MTKSPVLLTFTCLMLLAVSFLFLSVAPSDARVIIKERIKYYTVTGKTGRALSKSILKRGPKLSRQGHAIATTTIDFKVRNFKPGIRGRKCIVQSVDVNLTLTYKYPRWKNRRGASKTVRNTWDKFFKQIQKHERTHGKIAKEFARDVDRQIKRLSGRISRGCKDFGRGAAKKFARLVKNHETRQIRFDRRESRVLSRTTRLQVSLFKAK